MRKFAAVIVNHRKLVFLLALVVAAVCAVLMTKVNINTDMTKYLPDSSSMAQGLAIMEEQFPDTEEDNTIRVMFTGMPDEEKEQMAEDLAEIPNVSSVSYEADSEDYNSGEYTLYTLNIGYDFGSDEMNQAEQSLVDQYTGVYDMIYHKDLTQATVLPTWILVFAVVIVLAVLLVMCGSWLEPFLFLIAIGLGVVMNMGTNLIMGTVSQTTYSIAAILQLVLSMDYSVMLMAYYRQERKTSDAPASMRTALAKALLPVSGSSVTTIVGLLMLIFMSFKIGADMGIVLAKGVFISLICVFTVLPALIVMCDKWIMKTRKPIPRIPMAWLTRFSNKFRFGLLGVFLVLFVAVIFLKGNTGISYTLTYDSPIDDVFPSTNSIVVVYENQDEEALASLVEELNSNSYVKSAMNYTEILGKEYTSGDLADALDSYGVDLNLDASVLDLLYYNAFDGSVDDLTVSEFLNFLSDQVVDNETFSQYMDEDMADSADSLQKFADADALTNRCTIGELADFLGLDSQSVQQLLLYYYIQNGGTSAGTMTLAALTEFLLNDVASDETYGSMLDSDTLEQIRTLQTYTDTAEMTKQRSYSSMANLLGMDSSQMQLLYIYYYAGLSSYNPGSMTLAEFVRMAVAASEDSTLSSYFDAETAAELSTLSQLTDPVILQTPMSSQQIAAMLGLDPSLTEQLFQLYALENTQTESSGEDSDTTQDSETAEDTASEEEAVLEALYSYLAASGVDEQQLAALEASGMSAEEILSYLAASGVDTSELSAYLAAAAQTEEEDSSQEDTTLEALYGYLAASGMDAQQLAALEASGMSIEEILSYLAASGVDISELSAYLAAAQAEEETAGSEEESTETSDTETSETETEPVTMSLADFVSFLVNDVAANPLFASYLDQDTLTELITMETLMQMSLSGQSYSSTQISQALGMDSSTVRMLYTYAAAQTESSAWRLSAREVVNFLVSQSGSLSGLLDSSELSQLTMLQSVIEGSIAGTAYTPAQLSSLLGMDESEAESVYLLYRSSQNDTGDWGMSVQQLLAFLNDQVLNNDQFAGQFSQEDASTLKGARMLVDAVVSGEACSAEAMTDLFRGLTDSLDENTMDLLYLYYASQLRTDPAWGMTLPDLLDYIASLSQDSRFSAWIDQDMLDTVDSFREQLDTAAEQMRGSDYSRLILTTTLPAESQDTTDFLDQLDQMLSDNLSGNYYIIGNSPMAWEMSKTFRAELTKITLLTALAIFVVVLISFRSVLVPIILVLLIQTAVYVTMVTMGISGQSMYYLALLVVQSILMGATIDYAILYTNYYRTSRKTMGIKASMLRAYTSSINTMLTSGLIIILATAILGFAFSDMGTRQICFTIARGAAISIVLILLFLPGILASLDRFIAGKNRKIEK